MIFILGLIASSLFFPRTERPEGDKKKEFPKTSIVHPRKSEREVPLDTGPVERTETKEIPAPPPVGTLPRVAIVIDDLGYNSEIDGAITKLNAPLSLSFLPFGPHTQKMATLAHDRGKEVLLHLPMEPIAASGAKMGPGALLLNMSDAHIAKQVDADLNAVPYAKGINNHMGSRFTADAEKMKVVLGEAQRKGLFYLDSRTTAVTQGPAVARAMGIKAAERNVFLDNVQEEAAIREQLTNLVARANKNGSAIGIGHAHRLTYEVLRKDLPALKKEVELVRVSELTK